ncbi:MAG: TPM domain-containing protein [Treponema sp.]|nr:TPM domain-containing protein [Treponema sp.]
MKNKKSKRQPGNELGAFFFLLIFFVGVPLAIIKGVTAPHASQAKMADAGAQSSYANQADSLPSAELEQNQIPFDATKPGNADAVSGLAGYTAPVPYGAAYKKNKNGLYELAGPVMDTAHILDKTTYAELSDFLLNLDKSTGVQIAVLTVQGLGGESIESFSMKYAEAWKLGQQGIDNGALLTVAMNERDVRIETGYGTEGVLTDALCSRILRSVIIPAFQKGEYATGIRDGIKNMAGIITGDKSLVSVNAVRSSGTSSALVPLIVFSIFIAFYIFMAVLYSSKRGIGSGVYIRPFIRGHGPSGSIFNGSGFGSSGGHRFNGGGGGFGGGGSSGHW